MDKRITIHLRITGRVQGVGYRAWAKHNAVKRELHGWVCNLNDGSVAMVISGTELNVQAMIEACREGPLAARVTNLEVTSYNHTEIAPRFMVLETR